jgi:ABC-type sugar transport system substrate-binding protein
MAAKRIVLSLLTEAQEFQLLQAAAGREAAARAGFELEVLFADNNAVLQIHQLFAHIHAPEDRRPAAIIVETVSGDGLDRVARNAVNANIGWVLINRGVAHIEKLRAEKHDVPIATVSVDNLEAGRIQGRQLRALLPGGGRALYLQGPAAAATAADRLQGAQEVTVPAGIELRILNGDWTEESAEKAVAGWLRLKTSEGFRPGVVCCQNDSMAVGARRALRRLRREWDDLLFTGCDGLPDGGQKLVRSGELAATIVTPPPAGEAVAIVARALGGTPAPAELRLAPRSFPSEQTLSEHVRSLAKAAAQPAPHGKLPA